MSLYVLCVVIALQVIAFQFLYRHGLRAIGTFGVGAADLPAEISDRLNAHYRKVIPCKIWCGALLLAVLCLLILIPGPYVKRKLGMAAVSIASGLELSLTMILTQRVVARLAALAPKPRVLSASLERDTLGRFYPPILEAVPLVLILGTWALTIVLSRQAAVAAGSADPLGLWLVPGLQVTVMVAGVWRCLHSVHRGKHLSQRARAHLGTPEQAVYLDKLTRQLELRAMFLVRALIIAGFAAAQIDMLLGRAGKPLPGWFDYGFWVLVAAATLVFTNYIRRLAGSRKEMVL